MALNLEEVAAKFEDDAEYELNGEKFKGADFKAYVKSQSDRAAELRSQADARAAEAADYRKKFEDTSASTAALLRQASEMASRPDLDQRQQRQEPLDEFDRVYGNDPVFSDFAQKYTGKVKGEIQNSVLKPFIETELAPVLKQLRDTNQYLTRAWLDEKTHREFREVGDWPEGYDLEKARSYAKEKRYFQQGGESWEVPDLKRVNNELMAPIRERTREESIRADERQKAAMDLRQNMNVIQMPNRTMGPGGKPVTAKGHTPDAIFGNVVEEAMKDSETLRMIAGQK